MFSENSNARATALLIGEITRAINIHEVEEANEVRLIDLKQHQGLAEFLNPSRPFSTHRLNIEEFSSRLVSVVDILWECFGKC